jgi:tetratricopeptide (TPR) repeat protein
MGASAHEVSTIVTECIVAIKIRKKVESPEEREIIPEVVDEDQDLSNAIRIPDKSMDDRFVRSSATFFAWVLEHGRQIALAIVIIVVCVIAISYFARSKEASLAEKSSSLSDVLVTLRAPTQAQADAELAMAQARLQQQGIDADTQEVLNYTYTVPSEEVRREVIYNHLQKSLPTFQGELIQAPFELMSAGFGMRVGKIDEAQRDYEKATLSKNEDIRFFALLGKATILSGELKYDEAIKVYEEIQLISGGYYASFAELNMGRLYEEAKEIDKAIEVYSSVVRNHKNPSDIHAATERLKLLSPQWEEIIRPQVPAAIPES